MEICLLPVLQAEGPVLDVAQGGFRPGRSALDHAFCLEHLCRHHAKHSSPPVLAFLDIKSAYDTVDRSIIWSKLAPCVSPPLFGLLRDLFDNVSISVILGGFASVPFSPVTGVLQGSVLSPLLYSYYIDSFPSILRIADNIMDQVYRHQPPHLLPSKPLNSLLYADDVVLIATRDTLPFLLQSAEQISLELGFRWNPLKCEVLSPPSLPPRIYHLYGTPLPQSPSFRYLGVPFNPLGQIDRRILVEHNKSSFLAALHSLRSIGLNRTGFPPFLLVSLFKQFVRPCMEYGLAIKSISPTALRPLSQSLNLALRTMFGGHARSETQVIQLLCGLPSVPQRATILKAKFIARALRLSPDCLLALLLPSLRGGNTYWKKLLEGNPLWRPLSTGSPPGLAVKSFLLTHIFSARTNKPLLSACPPTTSISPLLLLPMHNYHRFLIIRWRRGWLPGKPRPCPCGLRTLTRLHTLSCPLLPSITLPPVIPPTTRHPVDALLCLLPSPSLSPESRTKILPFWMDAWPQILGFLEALDIISHADSSQVLPTFSSSPFLRWVSCGDYG